MLWLPLKRVFGLLSSCASKISKGNKEKVKLYFNFYRSIGCILHNLSISQLKDFLYPRNGNYLSIHKAGTPVFPFTRFVLTSVAITNQERLNCLLSWGTAKFLLVELISSKSVKEASR